MIKKFYVLVWFLLAGSMIASLLTGSLTNLGLLAHAMVALVLVHGLALWAVFRPEQRTQRVR